ncbi:MAG TPA: redoxin, partial [Blastocatellia bacterium]|nr:redoxin [Blastocatellia bacterium]
MKLSRLLIHVSMITIAILGLINFRTKASGSNAAPTFSKDVAPILFNNCTSCHRPGEIAPMSFQNYKEVRPWAKAIREKVVNRTMPPWHADPHIGQWLNDKRLVQKDI